MPRSFLISRSKRDKRKKLERLIEPVTTCQRFDMIDDKDVSSFQLRLTPAVVSPASISRSASPLSSPSVSPSISPVSNPGDILTSKSLLSHYAAMNLANYFTPAALPTCENETMDFHMNEYRSSNCSILGGLVHSGWDEGDSHICPECGKRYSTSSNLARHRQTHRSITDKKARKCPHCDKVYVSMPAFSMHVRTHNQGCECPYCGKKFSRPWLLQGHIRTHTGEKPFKCSQCTKAFADKSNLRAHVQTHSSEKPYVCERCGKAFALKSYLYKHEESSCMRRQRYSNSPISMQIPL